MTLPEQFEHLTITDLNNYVTGRQEENICLDFKAVNGADLRHSDDKKNLAKALSGFSNSSGGLLVWGIDARKNTDGIDCASGTLEIDPLPLFISRLNELTGSAVSPIVEGVTHKSIPSIGSSGFAVTLIPESDSGPHMAKLGEDRYYKRSGDSFYRMEHFDLEDMFGRRKRPNLQLIARPTNKTRIALGIKNDGRGTAKAPFISFKIPKNSGGAVRAIGSGRDQGFPRLHWVPDSKEFEFRCGADVVIHPDTILDFGAVEFNKNETLPNELLIEFKIAAENMRIIRSSRSLDVTGMFS